MEYVIGLVLLSIVIVPVVAEIWQGTKPRLPEMHLSPWLDERKGDDSWD